MALGAAASARARLSRCAGPAAALASPGSALLQRHPPADRAEDQVVRELDADQLAGLRHASREQQVLGARGGIAARVGVEDHDAGGAAQEALLEDLARLDGGAVEGAAEHLRVAEDAMVDVQEERSHDLLVALLVAQQQVPSDGPWRIERSLFRDALQGQAAGDFVPPSLGARAWRQEMPAVGLLDAGIAGLGEAKSELRPLAPFPILRQGRLQLQIMNVHPEDPEDPQDATGDRQVAADDLLEGG